MKPNKYSNLIERRFTNKNLLDKLHKRVQFAWNKWKHILKLQIASISFIKNALHSGSDRMMTVPFVERIWEIELFIKKFY